MKAPTYDWRCHSCGSTNTAGTSRCAQCDFPAFAPGRKIVAAVRHLEATRAPERFTPRRTLEDGANWVLFFPEGIIAAIVLVAFPFWLLSLLGEASYQKAALLALFVLSGVGLGWLAWRRENKWALYAGVVLVLLGASFAI